VARQNKDLPSNQADDRWTQGGLPPCRIGLLLPSLRLLFILAIDFFRSRRDLLLENLAIRQQLAVLKQKRPQPRFAASDRFFWVMLRRFWGDGSKR
jgi:hypothetical protein